MLIGSYNHTIDAKGRLFIPAKWREDLGSVFIVTKGFGKCLFGMSLAQWQVLAEKLASLPMADVEAQDFVRYLSSWATDCELDKQGRILIPPKLREVAQLEKDTTLIGVTSRIEIWNTANWEEQDQHMASQYDAMMRSMAARGF